MRTDGTVLSIEGLKVSLPHREGTIHAVRDVSFDIGRGETVCVVGESGCGKSMTAMAVLNLLPRGARREARGLHWRDEDILKAGERRMRDLRGDRIGMIFQEPLTALNPSLPIGEQLMEVYRRHRPRQKREARARAIDMLGQVGIPNPEERLSQFPYQLSGGLRQRVVIAMALMCEPELIIADEPTTALDVTIQAQILRLLIDLKDRFGLALMLITHDLAVASRVADRIVVMYAGEVVEEAATAEFFARPLHPYARGLLGCLPSAHAGQRDAPLQVIPGTVPSLIGELTGCAFRDRCALAEPACRARIPLTDLGGHKVRCIRADAEEGAS
ncbi:ABC transporter ATP-binding protein [Frigidibacter sp. ROC022]|uniref:ABC transporter ATP-binding protein n=1 Tax=Frigidibacter sp. ROC022 TaxID=2971796 RepID=UPI00215B28D6|nr:ABC transporter ATP-binding protein [Frigidibacter sp. ROC022]MCR8722708.1 ABC transporter ATP-binding protein [Frigidibacter sp. ROC022]